MFPVGGYKDASMGRRHVITVCIIQTLERKWRTTVKMQYHIEIVCHRVQSTNGITFKSVNHHHQLLRCSITSIAEIKNVYMNTAQLWHILLIIYVYICTHGYIYIYAISEVVAEVLSLSLS